MSAAAASRSPAALAASVDPVVPALRLGELFPRWALGVCLLLVLIGGGYAALASRLESVALERYVPGWLVYCGAAALLAVAASRRYGDRRPESIVLLAALVAAIAYVACLVPLSVYQYRRRGTPELTDEDCPTVSVLIPAYNERGYVGSCIESVLEADYPAAKLELLVIDDGSTDNTYREAAAYDEATVLRKPNGGKYSALNYGLVHADGEIVVIADADTRIEPASLRRLVATLVADPDAGAATSAVAVANRSSVLARCQALEYALMINTVRRAFDWLGCVPIVSGCLGAFRREALEEIGGFDPDTLTEDFDATAQVLRAGWTVRASPARAWTEAPSTLRDLYRQRLRWYRGNAMTIWKHRRTLWGALEGQRSFRRLVLPLFAVSVTVLPLAGFVVLAAIALAAAGGLVAELAVAFVAFLAVQTTAAAIAIAVGDHDPRLLVYAPLLLFGYKQFLDAVAVKALVDVARRRSADWTSAERAAHRSRGADDQDSSSASSGASASGSASIPWRS